MRPSSGTRSDDIDIAFAQFEEGSTPSSYIPTSGSQVARAAEARKIDNADFPTELQTMPAAVSAALHRLVTYADEGAAAQVTLLDWRGDASNRITLAIDTDGAKTGDITLTVVNSGSSASVTAASAISPGVNQAVKIALRVSASEINIAVDGTSETAVASPGVPDLSSANINFGGMVTDARELIWAEDILDSGMEEATA